MNAHFVFWTMKGSDLTHQLSNSINVEQDIIIRNSKWRNCTKNDERGRFNALFAILIGFERILIIPVLVGVSWKLYISRSFKCTFRIQNDDRRRFNTSVAQNDQCWTKYNHSQLDMVILYSKTKKRGALTRLFEILIGFDRISIIPV